MSVITLCVWILGLGLVTVVGSLSARKYDRPTLLAAMAAALSACGHLLPWPLTLPAGFPGPVPVGALPQALAVLPLCALVEKFGQREGHRASLFLTVGGAMGALVLWWTRAAPGWNVGGGPGAAVLAHLTPWVSIAALIGTLIGANAGVVLYHMARVFSGERHVWLRAVLAIGGGGLVESFVYLPLAFAGRDPLGPFLAGRATLWGLVALCGIPLVALHRAAGGRRASA